jgi:hypothetical protein
MHEKFYLTFGQVHVHSVKGRTFDKDCVGEIYAKDMNDARELAFQVFGDQWHRCLDEKPNMEYFPRGVISVNGPGGVTHERVSPAYSRPRKP